LKPPIARNNVQPKATARFERLDIAAATWLSIHFAKQGTITLRTKQIQFLNKQQTGLPIAVFGFPLH
jgi:hypothetical protein